MNVKYFIGIAVLFLNTLAWGQEVVVGLQTNESVKVEAEKWKQNQQDCQCRTEESTALNLPFFDDFATNTVYPDAALWINRDAFINKSFSYMPPNQGVATLDAIDEYGDVYEDLVWYPPLVADRLTSQPIRLDSVVAIERKLTPADSLYLSFFYQPQGVGFDPEPWDTLVLEFGVPSGDSIFVRMDSITVLSDLIMEDGQDSFEMNDTLWAPASEGCNPMVYMINYELEPILRGQMITVLCDSVYEPVTNWEKVWYAEGSTLADFYELHGRNFLQVMVPVVDSVWFNPEFQFRFFNYATISNDVVVGNQSNNDQWNIDYIYLNYNRSAGDTTYRALTFSQSAPSFLLDYQVMPYRQYRADPTHLLKSNLEMYIANLDNVARNTSYEYRVQQVGGTYGFSFDGGSCNLGPFYETGFQKCEGCGELHACPPINNFFNADNDVDTMSFIIKHYISDSSDQNPIVDSAIYRQGFYNYFAYDDGVPEEGYGVTPRGSHLAYQFTLSKRDTLQGVQMYFNKTQGNTNELYFKLMVWSDNNGRPGDVIYEQENQKVAWSDGLYHFYPYLLDEPQVLTGTFYVGWEQYTDPLLNIGLDKNHDRSDRIFYDTIGGWVSSNISGSLLMRPIVGSNLVLSLPDDVSTEVQQLKIFPNPASTWFSVSPMLNHDLSSAQLDIFNLMGTRILTRKGVEGRINTESLNAGLYVVKVLVNNQYYTTKLLINR